MNRKISFIGTGNMGGALIRSIRSEQLYITDYNMEKATELAAEVGCETASDNSEAIALGEFIFLCVKPQVIGSVIEEISPALNAAMEKGEHKVLVSIAAGMALDTLRSRLSGPCRDLPFVRLMPNTPASIGKGMIALTCGADVPDETVEDVMDILSNAGRVSRLPEHLMNAFSAVAGCSPAFVYMFIEAMADGAVMAGLSRQDALTYAAQAVMGSASMVLETGMHPGALKDAVCSPAGSTIAGVAALERNGFRSATIEAITDAYHKNADLGKN